MLTLIGIIVALAVVVYGGSHLLSRFFRKPVPSYTPYVPTQADEDAAYQLVMASAELDGIPAATMDLAERAARRYRETGRIK